MELESILVGLAVAAPAVLIGIGLALATGEASTVEFSVVRLLFVLTALNVLGLTIYWLWVQNPPLGWRVVSGGIVGGAVVAALIIALHWVDVRELRVSTRLTPQNEPMPAFTAPCIPPEDAFVVLLGTNIAWTKSFPLTVITIGDMPLLVIDRDAQGRIILSRLKLYDATGTIIASVEAQDFWVTTTVRKRRPNLGTLIVYDHGDREVLKLDFKNRQLLVVEGEFRNPSLPFAVSVKQNELIAPGGNRFRGNCIGNRKSFLNVRENGGFGLG